MRQPLPLVSIAIPTYNRADSYLLQALNSALSQTYPHLEIIISDNCSTDNTETLITGFSDPRIMYFKQKENIGAGKNFAFCLAKARGKYFLLLHDDDLIDPDFIQTCMDALQPGSDVGIIRSGTRTIDAEGNVLNQEPNLVGGASTDLFFRGWFAGKTSPYLCSTLFHTERLRDGGGITSKHHLFDDVLAEVRLAALFGRVDVRDIKASVRLHGDKRGHVQLTSAAEVKNWCEESLLLLDLMCKLVAQNKEVVRYEGMRFFSGLCYRRASVVKSPFQSFLGYFFVFRMFHYKSPPPLLRSLSRIPFFRQIRAVKSKIIRLLVARTN